MEQVESFNTFYDASPEHVQASYRQRASTESYLHCFRCGGSHANMHPAAEGDAPVGCTLQPILAA